MLVEMACADAYGKGFEFAPQAFVKAHHTMSKYLPHPKDTLLASQYTDDTQMSLALAELMCDRKTVWTEDQVVDKFVDVYKRDPRDGYAKGFQGLLESVNNGQELRARIRPEGAERNGAAMRSVPVGLLPTKQQVMAYTLVHAQTTHASQGGVVSAYAVALLAHGFHHRLVVRDELLDYVESEAHFTFDANRQTRTACHGIDTVNAVLTVLMASSSLYEIIDRAVALGGDTDSVATIATGIASLSDAYDQTLPDFMYSGLESGDYGMGYLRELDARLLAAYPTTIKRRVHCQR